MANSPPIGTAHTAYVKTQEEELITLNIYPGKKYLTLGIYPTSNFISVKCTLQKAEHL